MAGNRYLIPFLILFLWFGKLPETQAFHIRAGDITAKSDTANPANPLVFHFKMVTYKDDIQPYDDKTATFFFSDGSSQTVARHSIVPLANNTSRQVFYVSHTFPGPGVYTVLYQESFRNTGIINIPNSNQTTFLLKTTVSINPQVGLNRMPLFTVPPLDIAASGQIFIHFPGAYDLDQDSIAYRITTPLENNGTILNPIAGVVSGYLQPTAFGGTTINDPVTGEPGGRTPTRFDLNPVTGEIRWNVPNLIGKYNIAFVVEEWRRPPNGRAVKLGEIHREMQIRVEATQNTRPALIIPRDTCVIANTSFGATVTGSDPNTPPDPLVFNAYSGIIPPATFTQTGSNSGRFQWTPQCTDISEKPYEVIFKVTDQPGNNNPPLIDMKAWYVTVVGPKPTGLTTTLQPGNRMLLTWNPYLTNGCGNAEKIHIYRRVNKANFNPASCETGVPASTGYVKIGEVPATVNTFLDTNNGQELTKGSNYCYMIYASFPGPKHGESLASDEVCAEVPILGSVLTKVSVTETGKTTGKIDLRWSKPLIGLPNLTGPFEYRLYRAFGLSGNRPYTQVFSSTNMDDTVFTDLNLNTLDSAYHYKIEFYSRNAAGQLNLLESGNEASSVRLEGISDGTEMNLEWKYATPWDNSIRKHIIYREINNVFVVIDSVLAGPEIGKYTDKGTFNNQPLIIGREYCYKILTVGSFAKKRVPPVVENFSQILCRVVRDKIPPCPPTLSLALLNCDSLERTPFRPPYQNKLKWEPATGNNCDDDIASYNVYTRHSDTEDFRLVANTRNLNFIHQNLLVPTGCYAVTAIDSSGNESSFSNVVCQQVCNFLEFPNIISPNNDGLNDTFRPRNSAFIRSVKFTVYNRWGVQIYSQTTGPNIDWGGVNNNGTRTSDGIYYYTAEVEFADPGPAANRKVYKGWVEVVQETLFRP